MFFLLLNQVSRISCDLRGRMLFDRCDLRRRLLLDRVLRLRPLRIVVHKSRKEECRWRYTAGRPQASTAYPSQGDADKHHEGCRSQEIPL